MERRRPPRIVPVGVVLFVAGMAGIYLLARGIATLVHGGSHRTGTVLVVLGVVCYGGGILVGRWTRRRRLRRG